MSSATAFTGIFGTTDHIMSLVLDDLTDEQACARPRGEGGPSISWVVGHLLHYRLTLLGRFGVERPNPYAELFGEGSATDGEGYPSIGELDDAWKAVAGPFGQAIGQLADEQFDRRLDEPWRPDETLRDRIAFMAWHEAYHVGAIGQIRKSLGLPGPAERMMEAR